MKNIKVTLLNHTPLYIASDGARTCWASQDKSDTAEEGLCPSCNSCDFEFLPQPLDYYKCNNCNAEFTSPVYNKQIGPKDLALLDRVGNQFHHGSILEHISFNFFIDGISRACLQELARHRLASLSVKSSRYTLKELKELASFVETTGHLQVNDDFKYVNSDNVLASNYLVMTSSDVINSNSVRALDRLRAALVDGISNDIAKYCMPESYRTQLTWSINLRSLQNFLSLRTDKKALPEIQHLARLIYEALPAEAQSLVKHCVKLEQE